MNIRQVLRTYSLLRQLTDDESAFLETLRGLNDTERESLVVALQPGKVTSKRATKKSSSKSSSKSPRGQSISEAIQRTPKTKVNSGDDANDDPNEHCQKEFPGGFICNEPADANVHHLRGATGYHEFDARKSVAQSVAGRSSVNDEATATTANSATGTEDVSNAHHVVSGD